MTRARERAVAHAELLRWIASLGAVTSEALACRCGIDVHCARARLQALRHKKLVSFARPLTGGSGLWAVTARGLSIAGMRGMEACCVSPANARHLAECATVAVELERRLAGSRVIGERELRRDEREAGATIASATIGSWPDGGPRLHRPDLVVWPSGTDAVAATTATATATDPDAEDGRPLAVEVELTVKQPKALLAILRAWTRCRLVAGVLYVVSPTVEPPLRRALARLEGDEALTVVPLASMKRHPLVRPPRPRPRVWRV